MLKPTISILGCGWLGFPLGKSLVAQNYTVNGSTTSREKLAQLKIHKINPYYIHLTPKVNSDVEFTFFNSEILVLTIPFSRSFNSPLYYRDQVESVLNMIATAKSPIKKIIFTSSTVVYPDQIACAQESSEITEFSDRSSVLSEIEKLLLSHSKIESVILRLAGLYGEERKLGRFLAGQKEIPNGDSPVNLVHLDDCIGIVKHLIESWPGKNIFNVCCDKHPTRRELYTRAATKMGLSAPQFLTGGAHHKIVSNEKIKRELKFSFIHPNPLLDI